MISRLLTLSISQTYGDQYKVVSYNLDTNKFAALEIRRSELRKRNEENNWENNWDIFGVTQVEQLVLSKDELFKPIGTPKLVEYYTRQQAIQFFEENKMSAKRFLAGTMDYAIIKVDKVTKINDQKLYFVSDFNNYILKNKDYRWMNYWEHVCQDQMDQKVKKWIDFINKENNHIYLVLYHRKKFNNPSTNKWIVGFHCL
jgi:hypothetical protein